MELKKYFTIVSSAVACLLALTVSTFAAAPNSADTREHRWDITKTLNLSPAQKEQLKQQRATDARAWKELWEKLAAKRLELKAELEKPAVDQAKISAIIADTKTLMGEQLQLRVERILAMKKILTPEQFKKLQEGFDHSDRNWRTRKGTKEATE
jgi:Spy/CpxP family protein refolding chaperone